MFTENDIFIQHHARIQECFAQHFWRNMQAKERKSLPQLLTNALGELGINEFKEEQVKFLKDWYAQRMELAYLRPYLTRPSLQEILLHGHQGGQIDGGGPLKPFALDLDEISYQQSLEVLALEHHQNWNFARPYASFYLDLMGLPFRGTLIHHAALATKESKLFLRRLRTSSFPLASFTAPDDSAEQNGRCNAFYSPPALSMASPRTPSLSDASALETFLRQLMQEKKNILIAGATSSGKTSFLQTLLSYLAEDEHLIILEDTHELFPPHQHCTSFLANNLEHHSLADYCAYALRMRPDRLILGEMRGKEVIPFMLAMNTGHQGLLSSIHADSAAQALERVSILFNLFSPHPLDAFYVMNMICKNIHYVVHLAHKNITEIIQVHGQDKGRPFYDVLYPIH